MCPICHGRGEVEAGITFGFVKTGTACDGRPIGYPTMVKPNPLAQDKDGTIWFLEANKLCELWGIAVCITCHGTGMVLKAICV